VIESQPRQIVVSQKPFIKIGLVEWLKVKDLSSSPSTTKKKKSLRMSSTERTQKYIQLNF
jgi:hypothetical protein